MNQTSGTETNLAQATTLEEKTQALHARLCSLKSVIVAYSGGVDSAYLAYAAHVALGPQMLAVIADSASLARSQFADALDFAREHGIPLHSIETHELENEQYAVNGPDRCFHCKDELFSVMEQELERTGSGLWVKPR
jgi:pyridinium-3,5-biscarboxylic acid mononucleotide sulfurtransferase